MPSVQEIVSRTYTPDEVAKFYLSGELAHIALNGYVARADSDDAGNRVMRFVPFHEASDLTKPRTYAVEGVKEALRQGLPERTKRTPQQRVFKLLHALWCEIPSEKNGFANNFMQAITTSDPKEGYRPDLLKWFEEKIAAMLGDSLPPERRALIGQARFTHLLVMAFDGFVIGNHLNPDLECDEKTITLMASLLIGSLDGAASDKADARRPKRSVRGNVEKSGSNSLARR